MQYSKWEDIEREIIISDRSLNDILESWWNGLRHTHEFVNGLAYPIRKTGVDGELVTGRDVPC